jgi:uncharacterized protein (DUF433 family)
MPASAYPHIEINGTGLATIVGTPTRVLDIVLDRIAYNWDADEIRRQHPHLTLGQIHSALAFYYDHEEEMDRLIADRLRQVDELLAPAANSPVRLKLQKIKAERRQKP